MLRHVKIKQSQLNEESFMWTQISLVDGYSIGYLVLSIGLDLALVL